MKNKPNVLLILSDQQRTDTLGFIGKTPCQTPNLDQLAAEGISFDQSITPCPLCLPARTSIFTGKYPHQLGTMGNNGKLECTPPLLKKLREEGYRTDYAGKIHMGESVNCNWVDRWIGSDTKVYTQWCHDNGLPDGWTFNDLKMRSHRPPNMSIPHTAILDLKPEQTNDAWITGHAINLLKTRKKDQPFFLTCSFNGPHPPFKIPEPYYSMYDPKDIPQPPNFGPTDSEPQANQNSYYRKLWKDHGDNWDAWKKSVAVYWGFVTLIDDQVGRILQSLREESVLDDTLVIFSSDHGEMLGQHGLWHKYHAYEEALRVPLIMHAPWLIKSGTRSQAGSSLIDITPTILSACGINPPENSEGIDLSPAFSGDDTWNADRMLFSEHQPQDKWHGITDWRMATDNQYKYVWNRNDLDELYDLSSDPYELSNLINNPDKKNVRNNMRNVLSDWMQKTSDPLFKEQADHETVHDS